MKEAYEIKALGEMIAEEAKKDGLTSSVSKSG